MKDKDKLSDSYTALEAVVYCKDCRFRDPEDHKCDSGHGIQWQLPRPDDWFCADGDYKETIRGRE